MVEVAKPGALLSSKPPLSGAAPAAPPPTPVKGVTFKAKCVHTYQAPAPAMVDMHMCQREEWRAKFVVIAPENNSHPNATLEIQSLEPLNFEAGQYYDLNLSLSPVTK